MDPDFRCQLFKYPSSTQRILRILGADGPVGGGGVAIIETAYN